MDRLEVLSRLHHLKKTVQSGVYAGHLEAYLETLERAIVMISRDKMIVAVQNLPGGYVTPSDKTYDEAVVQLRTRMERNPESYKNGPCRVMLLANVKSTTLETLVSQVETTFDDDDSEARISSVSDQDTSLT